MKNTALVSFAVLTLVSSFNLYGCSNSSESDSTQSDGSYQLVWSDEFDYEGLPDPTKWAHEVGGHGWGNNELQYYTDKRLLNSNVGGGTLKITAYNEPYQGLEYTSARLVTKGKKTWTYGKFEIRAKIPSGKGTWPAIWMLGENIGSAGWPNCGEIDIMEHVGYDQGWVHGSIHTDKYNHVEGTQRTNKKFISDASTAFHVYGLEWTSDSIKVTIDDAVIFSFANEKTGVAAWPFSAPEFLLLNVAVGGNWGGAQGVDSSVFPKTMEVDYVRVYQKK